MRAKIIDGKSVFASYYMEFDGVFVSNPTEEMLANAGYKEVIFPKLKQFQHYGKLIETELNFIYEVIQEEIPEVFTRRYKFTIPTEELLKNELLKPRVDEMLERIGTSHPNAPSWLIDGANSIIGFDEILKQDAMNMYYGLGIITYERIEGEYCEVDYNSLPEE